MGDQPTRAEMRSRGADRRRSTRVLLVIPLEVAWERPDGAKLKDHAETEIVSAHGALLRMKTPLSGVKEIELIRGRPPLSTKARVVNTYPPGADGLARVAVELSVPSRDFWGLVIPEAQEVTPSVPSRGTVESAQAAGAAAAEPPNLEERPRKRRLALRVPMRIRTPEGTTEVCKTESLSKDEARFLSDKDYPLGTTLFVAAPYTPGEEPLEAKATVDGVEGTQDSPKKMYAIKFDRGGEKSAT